MRSIIKGFLIGLIVIIGILAVGNLDKIVIKHSPTVLIIHPGSKKTLEQVVAEYPDMQIEDANYKRVSVPYGQANYYVKKLREDKWIRSVTRAPMATRIDVKNFYHEVSFQLWLYTQGDYGGLTYANRPDREIPLKKQLGKMIDRSFSYFVPALFTSLALGFTLALVAVWKAQVGAVLDKLNRFLLAMPDFLVVILMQLLAITLAKATGHKVITIQQFANTVPFLIPYLAITLLPTAILYGTMRIAIAREWDEGYIKTAKAKGLSRSRILIAHILRNTLEDVLAILPRVVTVAITSLVVAEVMCSVFGLGGYAINPDIASATSLPVTCAILAAFALTTHGIVALLRRYLIVNTKEVS